MSQAHDERELRRALLRNIGPETLLAEAGAYEEAFRNRRLSSEWVWTAVTTARFHWMSGSGTSHSLAWSEIDAYGVDRDRDLSLRWRTSRGAGELFLSFLESVPARLIEQCNWKAPAGAGWRERAERLRLRNGLPVASWTDCPFCGAAEFDRAEAAVLCRHCRKYFSDPGFEPDVDDSIALYGRLIGATRSSLPPAAPIQRITRAWSMLRADDYDGESDPLHTLSDLVRYTLQLGPVEVPVAVDTD